MRANRPQALIIEPDLPFARVLGAELERAGWIVQHTGSARRAVALCAKDPPDLVITEIDLDDLDPFEMLENIQSLGSVTPVVICTQSPGAAAWDAAALGTFGVKACIVRPARLEVLMEAICETVEADLTAQAVYLRADAVSRPDDAGARESGECVEVQIEEMGGERLASRV